MVVVNSCMVNPQRKCPPRLRKQTGGRGTVDMNYGTRPSLDPLPPANISGVSIKQEALT